MKFYSEEERTKFWGATIEAESSRVTITDIKAQSRTRNNILGVHGMDDHVTMMTAVYYVEFENSNRGAMENFSTAVKLYAPGKAGFLLAFDNERDATAFNHPNPLVGPDYKINSGELKNIIQLYKLVKKSRPTNLDTLLQRFLYATSKDADGMKGFIEMVSIMESILVPDGKLGEVSYKFRLRGCAKLGTKNERKQIFESLKAAYTIRSEWLHSNKNNLNKALEKSIQVLGRRCIIEYLKAPKNFQGEALDRILLD